MNTSPIAIGIHPVHRRMAEIQMMAKKLGGFHRLPLQVQRDLHHCLQVNMDIVTQLDGLKALALHAYEMGDMDWQQDICKQIEDLETKML